MTSSREQFEEWAKSTNSDLERYKTGVYKGDFKNPVMRKMWLAWQASRQCYWPSLPDSIEARLVALPIMDNEEAMELLSDIHQIAIKGA